MHHALSLAGGVTCAFLFVVCLAATYLLMVKGSEDEDQRVGIFTFAAAVVFLFAAVFMLAL